MNADIKGLLIHFKRKSLYGVLQPKGQNPLSDQEAREYLTWCEEHGYEDLYSAPDWDEYLKLKEEVK